MQTEVKKVPPSMPSGNSSLLRILNYTRVMLACLTEVQYDIRAYIRHHTTEPSVRTQEFGEPITDGTTIFLSSINIGICARLLASPGDVRSVVSHLESERQPRGDPLRVSLVRAMCFFHIPRLGSLLWQHCFGEGSDPGFF